MITYKVFTPKFESIEASDLTNTDEWVKNKNDFPLFIQIVTITDGVEKFCGLRADTMLDWCTIIDKYNKKINSTYLTEQLNKD